MSRTILVAGALYGLLGVLLSAMAAHRSGAAGLDTSARFLLAHAPALLAIPALAAAGLLRRPLAVAGAGGIALGVALFSGDLAARALAGSPLFPMAAPAGGLVLMAGWALLAAAALLAPRRR